MKLLIIGYWTWFAISVVVLTRRVILKRSRRTDPATSSPDVTSNTSMDDLASRVAARLAAAAPTGGPDVAGALQAAPHAPEVEPLAPPLVSPLVSEEMPPRSPAADDVGAPAPEPASDALAGTVFAPRLPLPTRSAVAGPRTSLAEALRGIAMPSDLAPLVHVGLTDPERRAVFATSGRTVELVGAEVAAELLRLGYQLEPMSATDAIARRGDDALTVRMRTIGPQPQKGPADAAYPTAPAGSVVLDVEIT